MPDENFNRSEYISEKVTDILGSAVSIINNSDDPIATAKELENIVKSFVETAIDTNAKTRSEAEEQFAKMAKRNWGIYLNGKYVVIDLVTQAIKYDGKILDISGSSIDEGNDKLTPIPDKDYLWYMAKRAVGVAIDVLTYYAKPLMPLTLVGMAINQNHKAKI